jgi:hypothetical protein
MAKPKATAFDKKRMEMIKESDCRSRSQETAFE